MLENKVFSVIDSCKTDDQLRVAQRYSWLASRRMVQIRAVLFLSYCDLCLCKRRDEIKLKAEVQRAVAEAFKR